MTVGVPDRRQARVLKGFRDYLPTQMILRGRIISIFREVFERHGFEPFDTPVLEYLDVLTGQAGENEKLMYRFQDHGGRDVGMRYDLTVPLSRAMAMHQNDLVLPFKRYHIAPVWRAENTQRGRFREFWQCDADIAGSGSMLADAEVISVMAEALTAVGLPNAVIHISHRRLLESLGRAAGVPANQATTLYRLIDKLDKVPFETVEQEMIATGIPAAAAGKVLELVALKGDPAGLLATLRLELADDPGAEAPLDELDELFTLLPAFGAQPDQYLLDLTLARGLDYYTGPVFEARVASPKVGSVGGAGRYDGLIGAFLGRPVPATGMSLGLERIIEVVQEHDLLPTPSTVADARVVLFRDTVADGARLAHELRASGLHIDLSLQPDRGLGDQLKQAGRRGVPLAVIAGRDELDRNEAVLKDLASGEQSIHPLAELPAAILARLNHR